MPLHEDHYYWCPVLRALFQFSHLDVENETSGDDEIFMENVMTGEMLVLTRKKLAFFLYVGENEMEVLAYGSMAE